MFRVVEARGPAATFVIPTPKRAAPAPPREPEPLGPPPTQEALTKRASRARLAGEEEVIPTPETAADSIPDDQPAAETDLAATVVKRTLRRLASGELEPGLRDGLIAQQLLDRREEKAQDRQFLLSLAQALAGGGYEAPPQLVSGPAEPPDEVIEGYFEEVSLAPAHLRQE
jgi:hypothetical protein